MKLLILAAVALCLTGCKTEEEKRAVAKAERVKADYCADRGFKDYHMRICANRKGDVESYCFYCVAEDGKLTPYVGP